MARESAASIEMRTMMRAHRLAPPEGLPEDVLAVWMEATEANPDFAADVVPLLESYARTVVGFRRLSAMVDDAAKAGSDQYVSLVKAQARVACQIVTLSRSLRISPHSQRTAKKPVATPWWEKGEASKGGGELWDREDGDKH